MTLDEVIEKYRSESSKKSSNGYFDTFRKYFKNRPITPATINAWMEDGVNKRLEKKYRETTLDTKYNLLKAAYSYSEQLGLLTKAENPFSEHRLPPQIKQKKRQLKHKEHKSVRIEHDIIEDFLFKFMPGRPEASNIHSIALLAYFTGMRIGEICALKWSDVKTDNIQLDNTKERQPRSVALDSRALAVIQSLRLRNTKKSPYLYPCPNDRKKSISSKSVIVSFIRHWKKYQKTRADANFKLSFETLREAYVQSCQYNGLPMEWIKKQIGNKYSTESSYNDSMCARAIKEITSNPKNEIISKISELLRREIDVKDVLVIDIDLFLEKVKAAVYESRKQ